jgi:anti-anti-sigma factor
VPFDRPRSHWVVAELDARGAIDAHAKMCLRHGIEGALASGADTIVVDLRDLLSIDPFGVALFAQTRAQCHAHGTRLELLISGDETGRAIAGALDSVAPLRALRQA